MDYDSCRPDGTLFLKIAGVWPQGVNRLHKAIEQVNSTFPAFDGNQRKRVRLLKSNFTDEPGSDGGNYVIEIQVPFQTREYERNTERDVPLEVLAQLFAAIGIFLPSV